jgi:CRISPR-associated protein Cmr5
MLQAPQNGVALRDQERAVFAYRAVGEVTSVSEQKDYKIAVDSLGANIMLLGLAGAMAALERLKGRGDFLLKHLSGAGIPGLQGTTFETLPSAVRGLDVDGYILATREMLQVASWLKRAVQASFKETNNAG